MNITWVFKKKYKMKKKKIQLKFTLVKMKFVEMISQESTVTLPVNLLEQCINSSLF